jgi:hypothetical protein
VELNSSGLELELVSVFQLRYNSNSFHEWQIDVQRYAVVMTQLTALCMDDLQ